MNTKIAEITDRSACTAWSPIPGHPDLVVVASKDAGGAGFEVRGGTLEIYDLAPAEAAGGAPPRLLAATKAAAQFACVDWSPHTADGRHPLGLVVAGMTDGAVAVYDAAELLREPTADAAPPLYTVDHLQRLNTQPSAVKAHPLQPYQIAVGAVDGRVVVLDLSQASAAAPPAVSDPSAAGKQSSEVTAVAWNSQVAHILASSSKDGSVVVWDVAQGKAWCRMQVEHGPVADLGWSPTQGLYLLTASGDDRHPVIQIWDLGASTSLPLMSLEGHRAGILRASWCPQEDGLLLSCGKDHTTYLWDLVSMRPIAELPLERDSAAGAPGAGGAAAPSPNQLFGAGTLNEQMAMRVFVDWSPLKRGVALTCSLDRKVQFHSILALATRAGRVPKWMRPASSVATAFGGALVSTRADSRTVAIRTVPERPELVRLSAAFEAELEQARDMVELCERRCQTSAGYDARMWGFMEVMFLEDPRRQLLLHLGYDTEQIAEAAGRYSRADDTVVANGSSVGASAMSPSVQDLVKKALMVGNFDAAVECCFRAQNYADALLLASCGDADLWQKTKERYCAEQGSTRPYITLLQGIVQSQLNELVSSSKVSSWPETLAILSTYAKSEEFPSLCIALGERMEAEGDAENASFCYLCSGSVAHAAKYWESLLRQANAIKGATDIQALHGFVGKVSVYMKASPSKKELPSFIADHFTVYAQALADQGLFREAAKYVSGESEASMILRDRLYRSRDSQRCLQELGTAPAFPFSSVTAKSSAASTGTSSRRPSATASSVHSRTSHGSQGSLGSLVGSQASDARSPAVASTVSPSDELPPGWVALQDPSSGMTYFANQNTGETTWDRPQMPISVTSQQSRMSATLTTAAEASTIKSIVSKYGDGFVTSASHPELASQYGNVGTSNPYSASRPGTAAAVVQKQETEAPLSGPLDLATVEFTEEQSQIKDTLLALYDHLVSIAQPADARQLEESKKGLDVLVKKMARGQIDEDINGKLLLMCGQIGNYDFRAATATQTAIVNTDWRIHKDWLKGLKTLLQVAVKRLY